MSLARRFTAIPGIWLAGFLIASPAVAVPESVFVTPGDQMAGARSFWLAPFTLYTMRSMECERIGSSKRNSLRSRCVMEFVQSHV